MDQSHNTRIAKKIKFINYRTSLLILFIFNRFGDGDIAISSCTNNKILIWLNGVCYNHCPNKGVLVIKY